MSKVKVAEIRKADPPLYRHPAEEMEIPPPEKERMPLMLEAPPRQHGESELVELGTTR